MLFFQLVFFGFFFSSRRRHTSGALVTGVRRVLFRSSMSTDEAGDPPLSRKLAWGVAVALIAAVLLLAGGLEALQGVITIAALPFALLMLGVMVALYRVLDQEHRLEQRRQARARHAIRSEEHTSELQSLMPISYAVFCL